MVHIGNKIKAVVKERGISVAEFARRINTTRENIYAIFKRKDIGTGLLQKISEVLEHDFFRHYGIKKVSDFSEMKKTLEKRDQEIEQLKKENAQLKDKVIALLEKGRGGK